MTDLPAPTTMPEAGVCDADMPVQAAPVSGPAWLVVARTAPAPPAPVVPASEAGDVPASGYQPWGPAPPWTPAYPAVYSPPYWPAVPLWAAPPAHRPGPLLTLLAILLTLSALMTAVIVAGSRMSPRGRQPALTQSTVLGQVPSGTPVATTANVPATVNEHSITVTHTAADITISAPVSGGHWVAPMPIALPLPGLRVDSAATITAGPANGIGLACRNASGTAYEFSVWSGGTFELTAATATGTNLLIAGSSAAIHSPTNTRTNAISVVCANGAQAGTTHFMMAVNGATVIDTTAPTYAGPFTPALLVCTCGGADSARFSNYGVQSVGSGASP